MRFGARNIALLPLALLWLAGADLRLTMLAVPPVLPLIHRELGLSEKAIGLLSGLPVLLLGLAAIPGSLLIARVGARRAAIAGLLVVAATGAARGVGPSVPVLFAMTILMGAGIAVIQPALPTLVSEWCERMPGFAGALYANGLLIGEAVPAAVTLPFVVPLVGGSWPASLAFWSALPALTAGVIALATSHTARPAASASVQWLPDWRSALPWQLGLLLGGTGGLYFTTNAFLPDYLHALGRPDLVTAALTALNAGQVPASFVVLFGVGRFTASRAALVLTPLLAMLSIAGMLTQAAWLILLCAGLVGFFVAFVLVLSLTLPALLAAPGEVHHLSAGMFGIGYVFSCVVPLVGGALWDATGIPAAALLAGGLGSAVVALAGLSLNLSPARR